MKQNTQKNILSKFINNLAYFRGLAYNNALFQTIKYFFYLLQYKFHKNS